MPGPLAGIRVVDLTRALAGPYATMMLADAGADVVKVERPGTGDDSRGWGPPFVEDADGGNHSTYFMSVNRSKRSVELDLKHAADLAVLHDLLATADVLVENFRPGVMARLGLDVDALMARNQRLVVASITGFGEGGPDGDRSGFDQIIQGEAGLMAMTGHPGGMPTKVGVPITDILAGMFIAHGIVAALYDRAQTGRGQRVTTSLLASAIAVHGYQGTRWTMGGEAAGLEGNRHASIAPYGAFRTSDGWINIAVGSEGLWARFAPLVDLDARDERFATNALRVANWDQLEAAITTVTRGDTTQAWMATLVRAGVPAGRINTTDEVYGLDQVAHLGLVEEVEHPALGTIAIPGSPLRWASHPDREVGAPPLLGQHTDEVLAELDRDAPDAAG